MTNAEFWAECLEAYAQKNNFNLEQWFQIGTAPFENFGGRVICEGHKGEPIIKMGNAFYDQEGNVEYPYWPEGEPGIFYLARPKQDPLPQCSRRGTPSWREEQCAKFIEARANWK